MNQDQLNIIKNKLLYNTTDNGELDNSEFILFEKGGFLYLNINAKGIICKDYWSCIDIQIQPKSLNHVDRLIIAIKQLVRELE